MRLVIRVLGHTVIEVDTGQEPEPEPETGVPFGFSGGASVIAERAEETEWP